MSKVRVHRFDGDEWVHLADVELDDQQIAELRELAEEHNRETDAVREIAAAPAAVVDRPKYWGSSTGAFLVGLALATILGVLQWVGIIDWPDWLTMAPIYLAWPLWALSVFVTIVVRAMRDGKRAYLKQREAEQMARRSEMNERVERNLP